MKDDSLQFLIPPFVSDVKIEANSKNKLLLADEVVAINACLASRATNLAMPPKSTNSDNLLLLIYSKINHQY